MRTETDTDHGPEQSAARAQLVQGGGARAWRWRATVSNVTVGGAVCFGGHGDGGGGAAGGVLVMVWFCSGLALVKVEVEIELPQTPPVTKKKIKNRVPQKPNTNDHGHCGVRRLVIHM